MKEQIIRQIEEQLKNCQDIALLSFINSLLLKSN